MKKVSVNQLSKDLFSALQSQKIEDVKRCVQLGANVNSRNKEGETALQVSVQIENSLIAAFLLRMGADYKAMGSGGNAPFEEASDSFIHDVRYEYQRWPTPEYKGLDIPTEIEPMLHTLNTDGIVALRGFLNSKTLAHIQSEFNTASDEIRNAGPNPYKSYWKDLPGHLTKFPLRKYSTKTETTSILDIFSFEHGLDLMKMMSHPKLTTLVNHYLGEEGYLRDAIAYRYVSGDTGSYTGKWHIDGFGKQLHIMILLTDIGEDDQYLNYVKGAHKIKYPYEFFESRVPEHQFLYSNLEDCKKRMGDSELEFFCGTGKAGDVFLFDTNAVHRARRSNGKSRDVIIASYAPKNGMTWNLPLPKEAVENNALGEGVKTFDQIIELNKADPNGDVFPELVSWVKSLRHLNKWVRPAK